ncbi:DnaJ-class molecular chaperone CbpA [Klebsiella pneumoniae subsp. pneumoniae]|nr:DnaJ-class molecular chaperone CbpA [Klebsiella pneumoniae subsp. pneumoniae]
MAVFLEETLAEQTGPISYNLPVYNVFGMIESETPKTLNVKIPAGVVDGQRIRLKGQGTPGENGGPNGDLWLVIHIAPHPLFDIVGHNLEIVLPLAPWEAALGAKVTVPTLKREHSADGAAGQSGRAATAYQRERAREQNPHRRFVCRY